ncbi:GMC oxidoreductase [Scytonema sp. PCC 10023]|uniref:GMC oxidoreductase n=1 Tax=Scytonema sp. PCC 10023 TaxID=1680591 RepID=UPI0039C6A12F
MATYLLQLAGLKARKLDIAVDWDIVRQEIAGQKTQPLDFSATAHPLGGATIGEVCNTYGQVYGYRNLFVVDGSFIPGSTACTNPSFTIAALAERSMERFLNRSA